MTTQHDGFSQVQYEQFAGALVVVTGGTGFTGSTLVPKLVAAGATVRGIARPASHIRKELRQDVTWLQGSVYDPGLIQEAMEGAQYVFHVAACFREAKASEEEYWNVHVKSTQLLAQEALRQPTFKRFLHVSTVGVHGHIVDLPADETAPYSPGDRYQETKLEGELWIREFASQRGLPLVVIRPVAIMGPGDRRLLKLFKFAKLRFCPLLDGHNTQYHLVHVEDLTDCMLLAAHHPAALGEVFICGNEQPTNLVEILSHVGDVLGKKIRFVSLPSRPLFLLADVVEWISKKLHIEPFLYRRRMAFFTKDRAFETSKARELLGFSPRFTNEGVLADTAHGYLEAGWL